MDLHSAGAISWKGSRFGIELKSIVPPPQARNMTPVHLSYRGEDWVLSFNPFRKTVVCLASTSCELKFAPVGHDDEWVPLNFGPLSMGDQSSSV